MFVTYFKDIVVSVVLRWQTGDALQFWGMAVEIGCKKLYVFRDVLKFVLTYFLHNLIIIITGIALV